jgi:predicted histidine transporter YuiF (NhaC family)
VIEAIVTMLVLMQIVYRKEKAFNKKAKEEKERVESQIKAEHKIKQYDYNWYYM